LHARSPLAGAPRHLPSFPTRRSSDLAALSGAVLSGTEFGLPLFGSSPVLVEANLPGAAAEMDVDPTQLRIWLAARELAHLWLFADRKSTRLNSSHVKISYAVFCLKKK